MASSRSLSLSRRNSRCASPSNRHDKADDAGTEGILNESKTWQQLYKLHRDGHYGALDELFRGTIDWDLINEQRDQMVRVAAALKNRNTPVAIRLTVGISSLTSVRVKLKQDQLVAGIR